MGQIASSWSATMQKHMGLFSPDVGESNPLVESNPPSPPDVKPHVIWIQVQIQLIVPTWFEDIST